MSAAPFLGERIYRKRGREIPDLVRELRATVEAARSEAARRKWSWLVALAAITAGVMFASVAGGVCVLVVSIVILLFIAGSKPSRLLASRLGWVTGLLEALQPELHPRARVWLRLDTRAADHAKFCTFTGTSSRGRAKKKFRCPWLTLETTLADGTYLAIDATTRTKTKSGVVAMQQTRVAIAGKAHPARYAVFDDKRQRATLEAQLAHALLKFATRVDSHAVRPARTTRERCKLEVRARGTITPDETLGVVGALVRALGEQRADRARAAR